MGVGSPFKSLQVSDLSFPLVCWWFVGVILECELGAETKQVELAPVGSVL